MRAVPILIAAIAVLALGLAALIVVPRLNFGPSFDAGATGTGVDSAARIEIERLRAQIDALSDALKQLETRLQGLEQSRNDSATQPFDSNPVFNQDGPNDIADRYAQVVLIADRLNVNRGITVASPSFLENFLGRPRETLSDTCEPMTNPKLSALLKTEQVGPIAVTMLQPAIDSLKRVFAEIERTDPDLYERINTAGSLCVRQIRGTVGRTSTHAFGLAVDLNIDGKLDNFADGRTQLGLTILADFFNKEGWVWGAGFGREDSMHFEVSQKQLEEWRAEGKV